MRTLFFLLATGVVGIICASNISKTSPDGSAKHERLEPVWWVGITVGLIIPTLVAQITGWPAIPATMIGLLLVATFLFVYRVDNREGAGTHFSNITMCAILFWAELIFALCEKADKAKAAGDPFSSFQKGMMWGIPALATAAVIIVGAVGKMDARKKARLKAAFKPANIATAIIAIAAIVMVVWLCKTLVEVF